MSGTVYFLSGACLPWKEVLRRDTARVFPEDILERLKNNGVYLTLYSDELEELFYDLDSPLIVRLSVSV